MSFLSDQFGLNGQKFWAICVIVPLKCFWKFEMNILDICMNPPAYFNGPSIDTANQDRLGSSVKTTATEVDGFQPLQPSPSGAGSREVRPTASSVWSSRHPTGECKSVSSSGGFVRTRVVLRLKSVRLLTLQDHLLI